MKYLYVAAPPEVRPEDRRMITGLLSGEFDLPVREMEIPDLDFAYEPVSYTHLDVYKRQTLPRLSTEFERWLATCPMARSPINFIARDRCV